MRKLFFPLFFLITLFSEEIFCSYLSVRGILVESGMLQKMYIVIAAVSYIILLRDLLTGPYKRNVVHFFLILCGVIALFGLTSLVYSGVPRSFTTSVLYFGSVCIPASVCGLHLAIKQPWEEIDRLLPFFLFFVGISVGAFGMRTLLVSLLAGGEGSSLDYQNVSYFMAEIFSFSGYYVFFSSARKSNFFHVVRWLVYALMVFSAIIVVISGGRGGFLLLCVSSFFLVLILIAYKRLNKGSLALVVSLGVLAFLVIAKDLSIFESAGFDRISSSLTEDDARKDLYRAAWNSVLESPLLGHGLGSVWMEVGFYCHNIFFDLLVETGLLGTIVIVFFIFRTAHKLWRWKNSNPIYIFIFFSMLKVMVMTLFSGYWLNALQLWLCFGFVYIISIKRKFLYTNRLKDETSRCM